MKQNQTLLQFFEWYTPADGAHWERLEANAPRFTEMGITSVWLPPAYKGTRGETSEGYDVYDIYDLGEFDQKGTVRTKYGTKATYMRAVNMARQLGLEVYVDVVLNHMGGAEETEKVMVREVDPDDRTKFLSPPKEIEAYTRFTFPGRKNIHSNFTWDKSCFSGIDHEAGSTTNVIYKIVNDYPDWEPLVHNEKGNFDYLILNDIETRNPAVREELKRWIQWYYTTVPFDGVRLDAVKHINPDFFIEWIDYIRAEIKQDMKVIGEYWLSDDLPVLLKYLDAIGNRMQLFDAPLHHNFSIASEQKENYDLRNILQESLVTTRPGAAVTFVDNHDTQPLQSLEEYTEQWFKPHAYALILLRKAGTPCIFYPDLYGTCYSGKRKSGEHCEIEIPALEILSLLIHLRKEYAYGPQLDQFDEPDSIAWVRSGDPERAGSGCIVLLSTNQAKPVNKRIHAGRAFAGQTVYDCMNGSVPVEIDNDGYGIFPVPPASVGVWTKNQVIKAIAF